jgi:tetratricopeptide (TPR) repeat protein
MLYLRTPAPLLLTLVLVTGCISPKALGEADGHYRMGVIYLNEANSPGAISELRQSVKKNKWEKRAWHMLGLAYFAREMHTEAEEAFIEALDLDSEFAQAQTNLGALYLEMERWDEAIAVLEKAVANPEYREPLRTIHNLGWAWFNKGDFEKSREHYHKILRDYPGFCPAHRNLGQVEEAEGKLNKALGRYRKAVTCDPGDLKGLFALGVLEMRLDFVTDACGHLMTVAEMHPFGTMKDEAQEYLLRLECSSVSGL